MLTIEEAKKKLEEGKQANPDDLIFKLEKARNGANVHSINKAIFYLRHFQRNDKDRFIHNGTYDRLLFLKIDVIEALETKDWGKLGRMMSNWF